LRNSKGVISQAGLTGSAIDAYITVSYTWKTTTRVQIKSRGASSTKN